MATESSKLSNANEAPPTYEEAVGGVPSSNSESPVRMSRHERRRDRMERRIDRRVQRMERRIDRRSNHHCCGPFFIFPIASCVAKLVKGAKDVAKPKEDVKQ
ncbi:DEKNAAC100940 [Brettanomyces naardenensis]|uniref:DEKNAAC100940 n=1 Tax=Brettanomyces naardenensis TaxID=13370 RepID=A0A448YGT0_BRENA|nr:DEKNAAC100940 [Brettanomyces naardenensis]